jgi:hypothetical protein
MSRGIVEDKKRGSYMHNDETGVNDIKASLLQVERLGQIQLFENEIGRKLSGILSSYGVGGIEGLTYRAWKSCLQPQPLPPERE